MKKISTPSTARRHLESVVADYATAYTIRAQARAARDKRIKTAREHYEAVLVDCTATLDRIAALAERTAAANVAIFPPDRKSIDLEHGTIGFRDAPHRVILPPDRDEEDLIETMLGSGLAQFVRCRYEINRAAILQAEMADLKKLEKATGITVDKTGRRFFIKPKYS